MRNYIIDYQGKKVAVNFNEKSPLSGVKQFFKSNHPEVFKKHCEKNRHGQTFGSFLEEIDCKLDVVEYFDYSIKENTTEDNFTNYLFEKGYLNFDKILDDHAGSDLDCTTFKLLKKVAEDYRTTEVSEKG